MAVDILLLATLDTKGEEARYLVGCLAVKELSCKLIDLRLQPESTENSRLLPEQKLKAMKTASRTARSRLDLELARGARAIVGIGGGTGTRIIVDALSSTPFGFPKVLVSTLASDPRSYVATRDIILLPSICDAGGLNPTLKRVLKNAAAVVAGLVEDHGAATGEVLVPTVGLTALGVTAPAADGIRRLIGEAGLESTVFHANGYGGQAFSRWVENGAISSFIDLTIHELNWMIEPFCEPGLERRFKAGRNLPHVVLPGAVNFRTAGPPARLDPTLRSRPHYSHSPDFTHVALSNREMAAAGTFLARQLDDSSKLVECILPMGGFSSEDRPGGEIENPEGREAFAVALETELPDHVPCRRISAHINDPMTAETAFASLMRLTARENRLWENTG